MSDAPIMAPTAGPDQPLAAANISQLVAVALRLAMEVSTLRERLRTQQVLLEQTGVLAPGAVDRCAGVSVWWSASGDGGGHGCAAGRTDSASRGLVA